MTDTTETCAALAAASTKTPTAALSRRNGTGLSRAAVSLIVILLTSVVGFVGGGAASAALTSTGTCAASLQAWCAALAGAQTAPANVLVVGDSIAEGFYAPDRAHRWIDLVREQLQSEQGGSGIGYLPASDGLPSNPPFPDAWSEAGGTASNEGLGDRSYTLNSSAAFAQTTVQADQLQLSYTASPTGGAMDILMDGQQVAQVDTYDAGGTVSGQKWLSAPLPSGTHTIRVVPVNTGHLPVYSVVVEGVMVYDGDDNSGIHMWDGTHAAYSTTEFVNSPNFGQDVAQVNPDLLVVELGTNDMTDQTSPSMFESNLQTIITTARQHDSHPMSVVLMPVWDATIHAASTYAQYVDAEDNLAANQGYAIADLSAVDPTIYTADGIHPDAWGQQLCADTMLQTIDPTYPNTVPAPTGPPNNPLSLSEPTVPSEALSVLAAPAAGINAITAKWSDPADGSEPYDYYSVQLDDVTGANETVISTQMTGSTATTFTGLTAGDSYVAVVTAKNAAGSSAPVSSNTVALSGPPSAPTVVTATTGQAAGTAIVTWNASSSGSPDSYLVQAFDTNTGAFISQQSVSSTSATFTGLTPGHSYSFAVYAHNSYGYQSPAGSTAITLPGPPTAPSGVTATAGNTAGTSESGSLATSTTSAPPPPSHGYWLVGSDGGIFTFGSAQFYGSMGGVTLQRPVVGIVPTRDGGGYWLDASDGGVFSFGDTQFYGSIPGLGLHPAGSGFAHSLNAPIVGMVPSHDQGGYFMVASDGGVFAFGDAHFVGSCPGIGGCSGSAVAVMPDSSGNGYWLVTQSGSIYTFGDAPYFGAPGQQSSPITSAVATPDGGGYYVLDANGQVFAYGDANGGLGNVPSGATGGFNPATSVFATSDNGGYWVADALGKVFTFGDAPSDGDMSGTHLNGPVIAARGS